MGKITVDYRLYIAIIDFVNEIKIRPGCYNVVMKTICITGCNGYIGQALAYKLTKSGHKVIGIGTTLVPSDNLPADVSYENVDVRDTAKLAEVFTKYEVAVVYHLAGIKYVGKCEADPEECMAVNTGGTASVLEAMAKAGVPKIIFASTYAVYAWEGDQINLTEETKCQPKTVYGQSKLAAEALIIDAAKEGKIAEYQILRFGNVIGATDNIPLTQAASFIDKLVQTGRVGGEVTLSGATYGTKDGTSARDYIDVRDAINLMGILVINQNSGVFNVSSGVATTLLECVKIIELSTRKKIVCKFQERNQSDPSVIVIDNQKAKNAFAWECANSITDTLRHLVSKAGY